MAKSSGKKGGKKFGRNKVFCTAYRLTNRREKNKLRRLEERVKRFPQDRGAQAAIDRLKNIIRGV